MHEFKLHMHIRDTFPVSPLHLMEKKTQTYITDFQPQQRMYAHTCIHPLENTQTHTQSTNQTEIQFLEVR